MNLLFIGVGGFFGAISRFALNEFIIKLLPNTIALGTLSINVIGCLLIGLYLGNSIPIKDSSYYFFVIGFLGSFTTMSAFTHQTVELINTNTFLATSYIISTIFLCILATYIGTLISR